MKCEMCPDSTGTPKRTFISVNECKYFTNQEGMLACEEAHRPNANNDNVVPPPSAAKQGQETPTTHTVTDAPVNDLPPNDEDIPDGDYVQSCGGCRLVDDGKILSCEECIAGCGSHLYSAIEVRDCKWFSNDDGALKCTESPHVNELR